MKLKLLAGIFIVCLLLILCISIDYADNTTITNLKDTTNDINLSEVILVNSSTVIGVNESASNIVVKTSDKIYTKYSIIGMYAKPSCGCRHSYTWHYREFVNYCPNCHYYGTLRKNPKGVPEREYTCCRCSSDFCGVCGKEKYSWSRVYLRKC